MFEPGRDPGAARRVRARRRRRRHFGALLAAVGVALLALAALYGRGLLEEPGAPATEAVTPSTGGPAPAAAFAPAPEGAAAPPAAEPAEPLPTLDASDGLVRERAAALSPRPELSGWLAGEGLVTRFVAAVDNVANGENPRAHLPELDPKGPFQASSRDGRYYATAGSWSRYDAVAAVFTSLDPQATAAFYRGLRPLFEQAYAELGRRQGSFDDAVARAIRELLRAPVRDGEVEVVPAIRSYRYADPELETLSPAQKLLLRMGARNARAVQAQLRELAAALALDAEAPVPASATR